MKKTCLQFVSMKRILSVIGITFISLSVFSQESFCGLSWGIKSGVNWSNILTESSIFDSDKDEISPKWGYVGGGFIDYRFTRTFSLSCDVLFSCKGAKMDFSSEQSGRLFSDLYFRLNYLDFPVMANFHIYKGLALKIGLQPSFLLSAKMKSTAMKHPVSVRKKINAFDCSMPIGVAYAFDCGLLFDVRYAFGARGILKTLSNDDLNNNSVFSFTAGFRF